METKSLTARDNFAAAPVASQELHHGLLDLKWVQLHGKKAVTGTSLPDLQALATSEEEGSD